MLGLLLSIAAKLAVGDAVYLLQLPRHHCVMLSRPLLRMLKLITMLRMGRWKSLYTYRLRPRKKASRSLDRWQVNSLEKIQFIIKTFYGQVVTLSTHPYGCRIIQRVLEHCDDPEMQSTMMEEILKSICTLTQDQYGNYGKPEERSAMISKLTGQIVKMSQQKFVSNVIEKCLTYDTPEECQLLINEMLGSTDENLQAMMKDQFANYVVQKVLKNL
ncbi:hypothetical protein J5N97_029762 [Dioscorea zingiberensis]|uniref:PUM-HD domain-containing protein n=1 Tax=Dioscorea zingiberensis TaxID=325984 RepID=A0A9D5BW13_9LILI|nr:hypothetical protein J5N97_029762 [Dioscorea zingiberensis]